LTSAATKPDIAQRCSDGRPPLEGFSLASHKLPLDKWFPPPTVPKDFSPTPVFHTEVPIQAQPSMPAPQTSKPTAQPNLTADEVINPFLITFFFFYSQLFVEY